MFEDDDLELPVERLRVAAGRPGAAPAARSMTCAQMLREVGLRPTRQRLGARLAPVRQGRPARDRGNAARRGDAGARSRYRSRPSTTRCTSSPRRGCCARSRSTAPRPISTPTPPTTITSSSKATTSCSIFRAPSCLVDRLPTPPEGYEIARVDVVVRLRRKGELRSRESGPIAAGSVPAIAFCRLALLDRFVGIDAPEPVLLDVAVEASPKMRHQRRCSA